MKISVIGLGKLGAPLLAVMASRGHDVIGVDVHADVVEKINRGIAPVREPGLQELLSAHYARVRATVHSEEAILASDITFVIVPTPSDEEGFFSNRFILQAMQSVGEALARKSTYHLVVISSTVMPGSTGGEIQSALETASLRKVGENLGLCYSPEFIALGSVIKNMSYPDMVLIGQSDKTAGDLLENVYRSVCKNTPPVCRMNFVNAELAKLAVNTFVTTKISYANMLSDICQRLDGGDVDVVTAAVGLDSRVGKKYLKGATAFGGPCFPRDNLALTALARDVGANAVLAAATQEINHHQLERLEDLIVQHAKSQKVAVLGLAYKPETYVVEESQGIHIANRLSEKGYEVSVFDPMAMEEAKRSLRADVSLASSAAECFGSADTILIMTPWPEFAAVKIDRPVVVIDCWRMLDKSACADHCDVVYLGVGNHQPSTTKIG